MIRPPIPASAAFAALLLALASSAPAAQDRQGYFDRPVGPAYCEPEDERVEVLLLGSYHMANPGADAFNLEADDVLAPKRQAEIAAVVDRLERFEPTHVAVEAAWGDTATARRWADYAAGEGDLSRNEREQIGFRLARQVGLDTIHPVDYRLALDFESLQRVAEADSALARHLARMQPIGEEAIAMMSRWLAEGSIGRVLHRLNEPEMLVKAHWPYVDVLLPLASGDDYAGPDLVADWYERNLKIFANVLRISDSPDDRIFLLFGQGHVPILRQLVIDHPGYCLEDPLPYLEGL